MRKAKYLAGTVLMVLTTAVLSRAQWVMVARTVSGQVQHLSQKKTTGLGYDVATVLLEAEADKVYQTALEALKAHSEITITKSDHKKHKIEFSNGIEDATMQATPLGPKATQLLIASTVSPQQPSATSVVVQGVIRVCKQMNVDCKLAAD